MDAPQTPIGPAAEATATVSDATRNAAVHAATIRWNTVETSRTLHGSPVARRGPGGRGVDRASKPPATARWWASASTGRQSCTSSRTAAAGLPRQRFHDLRHCFATLMLEDGEELAVVSKALGHSQLATTAGVYAHLTPAMLDRTAARMDRILTSRTG